MKKKFNADRIVSVSAIIVSLATLLMILYQTNLMRTEQRTSVMPSLIIGYSFQGDRKGITEKIWVDNKGLGPAFIEKIQIIDNTGVYETDLYGYFERINSNKDAIGINRYYSGYILPKNEGRGLYEKKSDSTSQVFLSNYFNFPYELEGVPINNKNKAVIEIYYKSIYGDQWKVRSDSPSPIEIE